MEAMGTATERVECPAHSGAGPSCGQPKGDEGDAAGHALGKMQKGQVITDRVHGWWEEIWDYPGSIFRYKLPPAQRFSVAFPGGMLFETGTRFRAVLQ